MFMHRVVALYPLNTDNSSTRKTHSQTTRHHSLHGDIRTHVAVVFSCSGVLSRIRNTNWMSNSSMPPQARMAEVLIAYCASVAVLHKRCVHV